MLQLADTISDLGTIFRQNLKKKITKFLNKPGEEWVK